MDDYNKMFEDFCKEYGIDYDFTRLGKCAYRSYETQKAFIVWSKASKNGL